MDVEDFAVNANPLSRASNLASASANASPIAQVKTAERMDVEASAEHVPSAKPAGQTVRVQRAASRPATAKNAVQMDAGAHVAPVPQDGHAIPKVSA